MAHDRPWYKRYGADFVMGCMTLPDAEHKWAYSAIVDMLNDQDRPLPDNPAFICGFTGLTRKKWSIVRQTLLDHGKLVELDGYLSNPRFEREHEARNAELEQAREYGRKGGLKSAEKRKAQQAEMDLSGDDRPHYQGIYRADKRADSHPDTQETQGDDWQKQAKKEQGPPQPTRARKEARGQIKDNNERSASHARAREEAGRTDDDRVMLDAICSAAGLTNRVNARPDLWQQSLEIMRRWEAAGVDLKRTALPAIRRELQRMDEPAHSLARFDAAVDTAHAKAGRNGPAKAKAQARFKFADEAPEIEAFRRTLSARLGPRVYASLCESVRFQVTDLAQNGDGGLLRVTGRNEATGPQDATNFMDLHRPVVERTASEQLGTTKAWNR